MNKPSEMNTELYLPKIITGLEVDPLILERVFSLAAKHKIAIQSNPISMSEGKPTQGKELPPLLTFDLINRFTINPCSKDWKQILENECQKFKNFLNEYVKFLETQPNIIKLENQEELGISLMKQVDKYAKKHDKDRHYCFRQAKQECRAFFDNPISCSFNSCFNLRSDKFLFSKS